MINLTHNLDLVPGRFPSQSFKTIIIIIFIIVLTRVNGQPVL